MQPLSLKNDYIDNIKQINRANSRIIELKLRNGGKLNDLSITWPYAPYMRYDESGLNQYWNELNNHIDNIPKKLY